MGSKKRSSSQGLVGILEDLSIAEKRAVLASLGGPKKGQRLQTSEEVDAALLECGRPIEEVLAALLREEASTPKKHAFFGTVVGNSTKIVARATAHLAQTPVADDAPVFVYFGEAREFACITFERNLESYQWVKLPNRAGFSEVCGKRLVRRRHATIVRINRTNGQAVLTCPGLPIGVDYDYGTAVASVLEALGEAGLEIRPLPVRKCISALMVAKGRTALPIRGDLVTAEGEIKLRSRAGTAAIDKLIARFVQNSDLSEAELLDQINFNLSKHSFETLALLWTRDRVLTRIAFDLLAEGADFLFVWGKAEPSFELVDRMASLFYSLTSTFAEDTSAAVWEQIVALPKGEIILPGDFRGKFSLPRSVVDGVILEAVKAGIVEPVYLLNASADLLEEVGETEWTDDLLRLRKVFRGESGFVDGTEPAGIRVAFRRIKVGREAS